MQENLELTHGAIFSQTVLSALVETGLERDEAYRIVQQNAQRAWDERRSFRALLEQDPEVGERLDAAQLDELFDYRASCATCRSSSSGSTSSRRYAAA